MAKSRKVILFVDTSFEYDCRFVRGILAYSRAHGPWLFLRKPPGLLRTAENRTELLKLKSWGAEGALACDGVSSDKVEELGLPAIVELDVDRSIQNVVNVVPDYLTIGNIAGEYFLARGFHNFAYCGFDDHAWSRERGKSFSERIAQAGFETSFFKQHNSNAMRQWDREKTLIADWLRSLPKPLALMACNDARSEHIVEACKIANLRIPAEIAVLGVDNEELICELSDPPLSSIAMNTEKAGFEAAELLDKMMSGQKIENRSVIIQPARVVARQSTDVLAIEDSNVAEAIRFIHKHRKNPIQVSDVVNATTLSRWALYKQFQQVLGKSILREIKLARTEEIARLLLETDMPVSRIAEELGYQSADHLARYFRSVRGISPLAYRKKYSCK
jgi:LacI family transcriptional regulator